MTPDELTAEIKDVLARYESNNAQLLSAARARDRLQMKRDALYDLYYLQTGSHFRGDTEFHNRHRNI